MLSEKNDKKKFIKISLDLPEKIKNRLKMRANENCRTMNQEIAYIVIDAIKRLENSEEKLVDFLDKVATSKTKIGQIINKHKQKG